MPRNRRAPQRTCIGCRRVGDKRDFMRVVRTPDGTVEIDPTGKRSGRGAYVCPQVECLNMALASQRLETALRHAITPAATERIREDLARWVDARSG